MKNSILFAGLILLAASCSSESDVTVSNPEDATVPVSVRVNKFSIEQEGFAAARGLTRGTETVEAFTKINAITLAFYKSDGTAQYKVTQLRGDDSNYDTFGEFSLALPMGSYSMVVLGYGGTAPITLNSTTEAIYPAEEHVRDTYVGTESVTIANTEAVEISATLSRVNSTLFVVSSDSKSDNASNLRMTFAAGGRGVNPQTGLATSNTGFSNMTILSANQDEGRTGSTSHLFLASNEQTMTVTLEVLDSEGATISHKVINNVPFKRNRKTKLTGSLYTANAASASFTIEDEPLDDYEMSF